MKIEEARAMVMGARIAIPRRFIPLVDLADVMLKVVEAAPYALRKLPLKAGRSLRAALVQFDQWR